MTDRRALSTSFLDAAGWGSADRAYLAGDASDRRYDRLALGAKTAVLMDTPPEQGDDPATFLKIAGYLLQHGLSAPRCLAQDLSHGFLLLEDLGDGIFAKLIADDPRLEPRLYRAAVDALIYVQSLPIPADLPNLMAADWAKAAGFALTWYRFAITGQQITADAFEAELTDLLGRHADGPRVVILRDFHAENLLWLPDRVGRAQVGLLDFQLAQLGQPGYDLVSLLQDARRDVSPQTVQQMKIHFIGSGGLNASDFEAAYAVLGAQRALRILGVFARLCLAAGKPGYLALMPRVWVHLQQNLSHPSLVALAKICADMLPEPTTQALALIGSKCGHFR